MGTKDIGYGLLFVLLLFTGVAYGDDDPAGNLIVTSTPGGADVYEQSQWLGATPLVTWLDEGKHEIRIFSPGYRLFLKNVQIRGGRPVAFHADLKPAGAGLRVLSAPEGLDVVLDGKSAGKTPVLIPALEPGAHNLVLLRDGVCIYERTVMLKSGSTVQVTWNDGTSGWSRGVELGAGVQADDSNGGLAWPFVHAAWRKQAPAGIPELSGTAALDASGMEIDGQLDLEWTMKHGNRAGASLTENLSFGLYRNPLDGVDYLQHRLGMYVQPSMQGSWTTTISDMLETRVFEVQGDIDENLVITDPDVLGSLGYDFTQNTLGFQAMRIRTDDSKRFMGAFYRRMGDMANRVPFTAAESMIDCASFNREGRQTDIQLGIQVKDYDAQFQADALTNDFSRFWAGFRHGWRIGGQWRLIMNMGHSARRYARQGTMAGSFDHEMISLEVTTPARNLWWISVLANVEVMSSLQPDIDGYDAMTVRQTARRIRQGHLWFEQYFTVRRQYTKQGVADSTYIAVGVSLDRMVGADMKLSASLDRIRSISALEMAAFTARMGLYRVMR